MAKKLITNRQTENLNDFAYVDDNNDVVLGVSIKSIEGSGGETIVPGQEELQSGAIATISGDYIYSTEQEDFTATTASGAKTVTISGLSFTLEDRHVIKIVKISSTGERTNLPLTTVTVSSGVITLSDMETAFTATDTVKVYLEGPKKSYDSDTNTQLTSDQNTVDNDPEQLVDLTNQAAGTTYYEIPLQGYAKAALSYFITADTDFTVALSVWVTSNPDATLSSDTDWVEKTTEVFGGAVSVNNTTDKDYEGLPSDLFPVNRAKVKIVVTDAGSGAANAVDVWVQKELTK